jgi:EAL domain-containing protein (putative c-di-GMP-specific phosphodiesterase class I)
VRAILSLGTSLGLQVIAEGVETDAQRTYLHDHGCDGYQGYLFGRPEPVEAFERFATRYRGQGLAVDGDGSPPTLLR